MKKTIGQPDQKKQKKKAPIYFEKTQSKRLSRQKKTVSHVKKKTTKETILQSIRANKKSATKKISLKKQLPKSTLSRELIRLEKYLAQSKMASRREAKDLIRSGKVLVNQKTIREPGFGINPEKDNIVIKGSLESKEVILFYKPRGIETSKTSPDSIDIHDRFPHFKHLAPVGRLDKDSEGLILLSNDGVLTKMVTGENSSIEKEYRVTVREDVMPVLLSKMERGIILDGTTTLPCVAKKISKNEYSIVLREGRKHQVRRMANACKLTVTRLIRTRIGDITIGKMTAGNFKKLPNEIIKKMKK